MQFTATRRATFSASLLAALAVLPLAATSGAAPPSTSSLAAGSVSQPTYEIALQEAWIPMPDGVRLSADVFLPTGGEAGEKFPVLLEYLPYRKNEKRDRNYSLYSYFVERGFVVARVDIRGTGNSEGRTIPYEYSEIEQEDGDVVIDWLSRQPYSNGNVGMFGISWGGFNAIHMAMRNPPALKAIIAVAATDDLYQDDVHYIDGIPRLAESWQMSHDPPTGQAGSARVHHRRGLLPRPLRRCSVDDDVHPPPAGEPLLGPIILGWSVRTHPHSHIRDRRLVRRLSRYRAAHAGESRGSGEGDYRPLVALLPAQRLPVAADRVAPRGGAMVRPLAARARHRNHGRARLRGIRAQLAPARSGARRGAGYLAVGRGLADRAYPRLDPACTAEPYLGGVGPGRRGCTRCVMCRAPESRRADRRCTGATWRPTRNRRTPTAWSTTLRHWPKTPRSSGCHTPS